METTGLSPWRHDRIVEIAIVLVSPDGEVHAEYETLVNPDRDIGPTQIHQISASDVLHAPSFADVAGDVLGILSKGAAIAGHNVSFDMNFLVKEYERLGVTIPEMPLLCTFRLLGRNSLTACCDELDIPFVGVAHRALSDARATAHIVSSLCAEDEHLLDNHRLANIEWPFVPALRTQCYRREEAIQVQAEPPRFLQQLAARIHHDVDAETPSILAYLALLDRLLEDRIIEASEGDALVDAALNWRLSKDQLDAAHRAYLHNLAVLALADGVVSDAERRDLHVVARLLGQDDSQLDGVLETAAMQLASADPGHTASTNESQFQGQRVCFTGEILSTIGGQPITREVAEILATQAGLIIANSVTKKLDILVVADPHTQSGKAKKARKYGTRILSEAVFWRTVGVNVD
ncbi:MAG: exonuclease domain-containing protein [Proteobacteria bacterium]|nr:exonuclease domain-containing protein [Pseudomonadota bacterium]